MSAHEHVWGTAQIVEAPSGHEDEVGEKVGLCLICLAPEEAEVKPEPIKATGAIPIVTFADRVTADRLVLTGSEA